MRFHAIAIILLMICGSLAGCIADEGTSNDDVDDTVENIDGTSNETVNQTTNDTAGNETTDGGNGTTNNTIQYTGFMDNSSIYGWKINPIENLSRIYIAYSEENCTNKDHGDDWNGTSYSNSICVKDLGQEWGPQGYSITYQNEELCIEDSTENYCWNMTVSNRVMWLQGDIWGGQEEICSVYIQSEQFVPSSGYHLALRAYDANGNHIQPDWDSLLNDPDYTIWNDERMDAYNTESSNAPAWCTDPQFGWIMPASQSA